MYRDDRRAARLRIEALEARLAEREADLARAAAALAARDEEIERLQSLGGASPRHLRSMDAAWATRLVGLSVSFTLAAAAAGMMLARSSPVVPPVVVVQAPMYGDPLVAGAIDWEAPIPAPPPASRPAASGGANQDRAEVPRQMQPRVWGGRPAADDRRMRHEVCPDGDAVCRERARVDLERARSRDF
jgi:hypothetical protein